jgi:hypothetical protein
VDGGDLANLGSRRFKAAKAPARSSQQFGRHMPQGFGSGRVLSVLPGVVLLVDRAGYDSCRFVCHKTTGG